MLIDQVLTAKEAEERWKLSEGLIRQRARKFPKAFNPGEIRKSGGTWLITLDAMERLYGKEPKSND
ncbi:helix-turn-helix domain-containing protein [Negativicoccus succinicivorans]|uniref:helix-turn-helix domain-containing protein n=1 Tax=Negativicoccus succinicivorans TaxID=620903 RepID=UPI0028FDF0F0|nr:helix-turn-helix domain-containing protein [Negativicoccus succinicivorans]MDU2418316.1 helix-turn-helix domain-containing protein [Negativicoccus succinicivorans]